MDDAALADLDREPAGLWRAVARLLARHRLPAASALLDQKIRFEDTFRTIFLYPFALSFVVTGLVWQWLLNPDFGVQAVVRSLGWESFTFNPLYDQQIVIYGILIAALWQGTGLVMCLMLAVLRRHRRGYLEGRARRRHPHVEDLPLHRHSDDAPGVRHRARHHRQRHRPRLRSGGGADQRGPGQASEVPAKYVYDYMFRGAQNLGQGFAASTMMLLSVIVVVVPWPISSSGSDAMAEPTSLSATVAGTASIAHSLSGPSGPRPRRRLLDATS